jgi:hypothetical protein
MEPRDLQPGDVVQLNPETVRNRAFAACMLIVSEPKKFGCQGYVQALGESRETAGGQAYYRPLWDEMEFVGRAVWVAQ